MRYKNLISLLIAGFLIAFVSNALAIGDGRLLRRSLEDTCHGCHKTDKNAKFLPDGSVNPDSIKSHNSDWAGTCSNTAFLNRFDCEANGETWTTKWSAQGGWGKEGTKYGAIVCTTCHTTHSTKNIYLIREVIKTPDNSNWASSGTPTVNVDFRYLSGSAGVTVGLMGDDTGGHTTSTRICEVCHSQTKYHRYNTTGQDSNEHQNANDCTVCHTHKKGFNPDFAASCGDCHGYPISTNEVTKGSSGLVVNDTQYVPNGETGRRTQFGNTAKGAHVTHFNKSIGCSSCHYEGKAGAPPDPRFDSKIQIGFFLSGTTIGGTYKAPAFTNPVYSIDPRGTTTYQVDPARTCSNLYCHSDGGDYAGTFTYRTISWDTTLSAPTCDKCHGNQAGVYVTTDKHPQHINASTYNYKCYECHANTTDANNNIVGTGHVNKTKDVVWRTDSGAMNPDAGAYSRPNCSNNYCHSPGNKGSAPYDNPNTTAAWNGGSLDCSGCHGGDATKTNKMNTMAHLAHINDTANQVGRNIGCAECHAATVSSNTTISSYTRHVDKRLQVKFDNSLNRNSDNPSYNGISSTGAGGAEKNVGAAGYTCSNVYCHSIGNLDSSGNVVVTGGSSFKSIEWNGSAINCAGCHGDSSSNKSHPIYASGPAGSTTANSHVKHVDDNNYSCDYCHLTTTTSSSLPPTSVIQAGAHLNRIENVAFKPVSGQTGSYNSSTKTCSSTYCHGSSDMVWGDAGATNCATCHDSQGAGGTALYTPKHAIHVDVAGYDYSCEMCHAVGGTNHATGPASGTNPGGDPVGPNQTAEISFTSLSNAGWTTGNYRGSVSSYKYRSMTNDPYTNNSISPTYADGTSFATDSTNPGIKYTTNGTCNNIWCHSTATPGVNIYKSVAWNATLNCGSCHNQAGDASPVWTAPHTKHINIYTQYTCNYCHATVASNNTTISSKALHVNASKDVAFNTWTGGTWSGTQCSNTYCHSNGTSTSTGASPTHGAISWSGTTTCNSCHTGPTTGPNYANGTPKANSHVKHTGAPWNYLCSECHSSVVNSSNQIISATLHANKAYTVNGANIGSYSPVTPPSTAGGTCSNVTCHGNNTVAHQWGTTLKCSDCHMGTSDVDNWAHDGILSKISSTQWSYSGHGKTTGTYDSTGNPAANFPGAAGTGDPCLYCHDGSAEHNITGTTNPIRLANLNWNGRGPNGNCMICHETASPGYDPDGAGTVYALKNATKKIDKYHYGTDHNTTYSGGQWCWDCHDPHGDSSSTTGPLVMVHLRPAMKSDSLGRPTESTSVDVVFSARANGSDYGATESPFNKVCNVCHTQTTYYRNNLGANGHYTDVCTSCHSHSSNTTYNGDAFSGAGGESAGGSACGTCHSAIFNRMNDSTANVVYKHYMNNADATYAVIAQPATLGGTSDTRRNCLTCHVDHNIFRPDINVNGTRAKNLRLDISMTPTTTTGFTDTDFDATAANGGICLSCHFTQQTKALSTPNGATVVPPIPYPGVGNIGQARDLIRNSTHNYAVTSGTFKDGSSFKAVCLKCHDDTLTKQYQSSSPKFGLHQSSRNALSAVMGSASFKDFVQGRVTSATTTTITIDQELTKDYKGYQVVVTKADGTLSQRRTIVSNTIGANATITVESWAWTPSTNDFFEVVMSIVPVEDMCFSCHSQGSNATGSGLDKPNAYKPTDGKDYYNTATMVNKLEQIFNTFNADSGRIKTAISNQSSVTVCTNSTVAAGEFVGYIFRSGAVVRTVTSNSATSADSTCYTSYGLANSMTYSWTGNASLSAGAGYKVSKPSMHPLDTLGRHTPDEHLNAPSTRPTTISQAWNVGDTGGTVSSASSTSITAGSEKMWNSNTFTGLKIYFTSGSCAGQSSTITGNTATQINFVNFGCTPAAGDSYYIGNRHVSCTDCHNTHAAQPNPAGTVSSATNTPPSNITIKDSEKTTAKTGWAADKWKGYLIMVTKANGFRQIRQITASTTDATGTTYYVGLAWNTSAVPAAGDRYEVFKLDGTTPPSGKGVWGVQIQFTAPTTKNPGENYAPSSTYTYTKVYDSPYQRDLCMKCHSYYGFLNAPPSNISGWGTINTIRPATDIAEEANPYNLSHHAIYDRGKNQPLTATGSTAKAGKYAYNPNWPKYTIGTVSIATNGLGTLYGTGALPQNILPGWMMYVGSTNFPAASNTTVPAGWYEIVEVLGSNSFRVTPGPSTAISNQTYGLTAGLGNTFIPPYGPWAILKCTDCHGSKLSDPAGPHASTSKFLIKEVERTIGYEFFTGADVVVTTAYNSSGPNLKHFCHNCHSANVYGHQNMTTPPAAAYSRVSHRKIYSGDPRVSTATFVTTEISCHMCHAAYSRGTGGADKSERTGGIHGSNYYNKGTGADNTNAFFTSAQGKRLLNGATWLNGPSGGGAQGVKRPTTTQVGTCYTRTTITDAINRCNTGHDNRSDMGTAEYDYDNP